MNGVDEKRASVGTIYKLSVVEVIGRWTCDCEGRGFDSRLSQGSVATYARYGGIFYIHLTANLQRNLPVIFFKNRLRIDRITVMSLWPRFLAHPVYLSGNSSDAAARYR